MRYGRPGGRPIDPALQRRLLRLRKMFAQAREHSGVEVPVERDAVEAGPVDAALMQSVTTAGRYGAFARGFHVGVIAAR